MMTVVGRVKKSCVNTVRRRKSRFLRLDVLFSTAIWATPSPRLQYDKGVREEKRNRRSNPRLSHALACGEGQIGVETLNRFSAPRPTYRLADAYDDVTRALLRGYAWCRKKYILGIRPIMRITFLKRIMELCMHHPHDACPGKIVQLMYRTPSYARCLNLEKKTPQ